MKQLTKKWNDLSLIIRILIGLILGAILGVTVPQFTAISVLGDVFVGALKAIAPVLVFILVMSSLANAKGGVGKRFSRVIGLYMLSTCLAAFVAVIGCFLFPVTIQLTDAVDNAAPTGIWEVLGTLLTNMVQNPVSAVMNGNYTNELVKKNRKLAISVLGMNVDMELVKTFGFNSMRDINKFENIDITNIDGINIINNTEHNVNCIIKSSIIFCFKEV